MRPLLQDFSPGPMDVICARGSEARNHRGNILCRKIIIENLEKYSKASSKLIKSQIVSSIVNTIREGSPNGGFVKAKEGRWYEIGDHLAREKVGQGLRDLLHSKYRSSSKAKKRRWREEQIKWNDEVGGASQDARCQEISSKIKEISDSDAQIQMMFNQANSDLLSVLKKTEKESKRRRIAFSDEPPSDHLPLGPAALNQAMATAFFSTLTHWDDAMKANTPAHNPRKRKSPVDLSNDVNHSVEKSVEMKLVRPCSNNKHDKYCPDYSGKPSAPVKQSNVTQSPEEDSSEAKTSF